MREALSFGGMILCGGKSSRMGRPKHLLPFGPETLLQRVVRRMREVVSPLVVVAAPGQELPPLPADVLIGRDDVEGKGPLAGLAVGLSLMRAHREAAFVSSCDAPFLEPAFVEAVLDQLGDHDLAIPKEAAYYHPLAAAYRTSLEPAIRRLLAEDRLRPFFLIENCRAKIVDVEDLRSADSAVGFAAEHESSRRLRTGPQRRGLSDRRKLKTVGTMTAGKSTRDVRMRGFAERQRVAAAWNWIEQTARVLESETVSFTQACGRVLAEDVLAPLNVPAFDRSAMDGFAVRAAETDGASDYNPLTFQVVGQSLPGSAFDGAVTSGTAVRIMTGAPMPAGADAVVPAEYAAETDRQVELTAAVSPGKHVGRVGEDIAAGRGVFSAGRRLRPQDVGLLASLGLAQVPVFRRSQVRILVTGNELVPPGEPRGTFQIYEANSSMLRGLIDRDGGVLESQRNLPDQKDAIREAMTDPGADVILVSGGSSVGAEDHAPLILAEEGSLDLHGLAMRPSSPAGMGRIGSTLVFLLPGNPVSCLCAYDFFAGRAIRKQGGRSSDWPHRTKQATLSRKIVSAVGRLDYCRVVVGENDQTIEPIALSGASILSSTTRANGFVLIPEDSEGYAPGDTVAVYLYD